MAVNTASAALLLLESYPATSQAAAYLRATQEHILECLASRGAAHFRQRLYDQYVCDISATLSGHTALSQHAV